jgi:7,8-dihydro-6-hydroxymethylpterin-pyrophosphokinase
MIYVSEYSVTREYGGPEEGGWWFDNPQHVRMVCICENQETASRIARALNSYEKKLSENDREPDRYSMGGDVDTVYYSEDSIGEHSLKEWPHYE